MSVSSPVFSTGNLSSSDLLNCRSVCRDWLQVVSAVIPFRINDIVKNIFMDLLTLSTNTPHLTDIVEVNLSQLAETSYQNIVDGLRLIQINLDAIKKNLKLPDINNSLQLVLQLAPGKYSTDLYNKILLVACKKASPEIIRMLYQNNCFHMGGHEFALEYARQESDPKIVRTLLEQPTEWLYPFPRGETYSQFCAGLTIREAYVKGRLDLMLMFLESGLMSDDTRFPPDRTIEEVRGWTVQIAAKKNDHETVTKLLKSGPTSYSSRKDTLRIAARQGSLEMIKTIHRNGSSSLTETIFVYYFMMIVLANTFISMMSPTRKKN